MNASASIAVFSFYAIDDQDFSTLVFPTGHISRFIGFNVMPVRGDLLKGFPTNPCRFRGPKTPSVKSVWS